MNQLTKLIQQYETENPGKKAYHDGEYTGWADDFVEWLASKTGVAA